VGKNLTFIDRQKGIQFFNPIGHVHGDVAHGLAFGEDQVLLHQVVKINYAGDISLSLFLNYSEFPNSCIRAKFPFIKDVFDMFIYSGNCYLKQVRHQFLGQPNRRIKSAGLPLKSPQLYSLVELTGVMWARVESARRANVSSDVSGLSMARNL
jgi:hypothetical protein